MTGLLRVGPFKGKAALGNAKYSLLEDPEEIRWCLKKRGVHQKR
jgi:hypothetical protein